ncbi:hypothetical protein [Leptothoe sp. PORK10 BA2]|uniref:hypothetical protein n=1 Tax=Leptothoe sp. PORK10 BA2 TaxID=3110254 RepID=UPI002B20E856|nr:hypothetical protein [Leptothoe sp. PORK10 BA2]MEA5464609.1 hypothetical protein [Leptothoe sp. PORK10 BA2]
MMNSLIPMRHSLAKIPYYFAACRTNHELTCRLNAPVPAVEEYWPITLPLGVYPVVDVIATVIQNGRKETDLERVEQYLFSFFDQVETATFLWLIQKDQTLWKAHQWPCSHKYVVGHEREGEQVFIELSILKSLYDLPELDMQLPFKNAWEHLYVLLLERYCCHTALTDKPVGLKNRAALARTQRRTMRVDRQNPFLDQELELPYHWNLFEIVRELVERYIDNKARYPQLRKLNDYWFQYADVFKDIAAQLDNKQGIWAEPYINKGRVVCKFKGNQTKTLSPQPYSKKNISGRGRKPSQKSK